MANTFTDVINPIYAKGLMVLREACVLPRLVNSSYSTDAASKGQVINIPKAQALTAAAVTPSYVAPDTTGVEADYAQISLSNWYETRFYMTDKEQAEVVDGYVPRQSEEAVRGLAYKVNATIAALYSKFYGYAGTAGTTPFASTTAAAVEMRKVLNQQLAPVDGRVVVLNPAAEANLYGLQAFTDASWTGDPQAIINGKLNQRLGFSWWMDQQITSHTAGTITTGLIAKASTAVAAGLKTFVGTTAASTGACALLEGDVISIAGHTTTYVLTAAATQASAATDVTLAFEPALERALVGSEAITVKATHVANLAFHRDAIGFASRLLDSGGPPNPNSVAIADPVSQLALRLEVTREHKRWCWSYDLLWGCAVIDRAKGMRLAG